MTASAAPAGTVAERVAARRRNPFKLLLLGLAGLLLVVVMFASVFLIAGAFNSDENGEGNAPWAAPTAPDIKPEPLALQ